MVMSAHKTGGGGGVRGHPGGRRRALVGLLAAVAVVLLVAGCGVTTGTGSTSTSNGPGTSTSTSTGASTSTATATATSTGAGAVGAGPSGKLVGQVLASPTCPVEPLAHPCSPAPVPHRGITIETPDGTLVETISTDSTGHFSATLPAGSYLLQVVNQPGAIGIHQVTPGKFSITAGQTTTMNVEIDTGIR